MGAQHGGGRRRHGEGAGRQAGARHALRLALEGDSRLCASRGAHGHPRADELAHRHDDGGAPLRRGGARRHGGRGIEHPHYEPSAQPVHRHRARHERRYRQRHRLGRRAHRPQGRAQLRHLRRGGHRRHRGGRARRRAPAPPAERARREPGPGARLPARLPAWHALHPALQLRGGHLSQRRHHQDAAPGARALLAAQRGARVAVHSRDGLGRGRRRGRDGDQLHGERAPSCSSASRASTHRSG